MSEAQNETDKKWTILRVRPPTHRRFKVLAAKSQSSIDALANAAADAYEREQERTQSNAEAPAESAAA